MPKEIDTRPLVANKQAFPHKENRSPTPSATPSTPWYKASPPVALQPPPSLPDITARLSSTQARAPALMCLTKPCNARAATTLLYTCIFPT